MSRAAAARALELRHDEVEVEVEIDAEPDTLVGSSHPKELPEAVHADVVRDTLEQMADEVNGLAAADWGLNAEHDPSPVGFHESRQYISMTVEASDRFPYLEVKLSRCLDNYNVGSAPFLFVDIEGCNFDARGLESVDSHSMCFGVESRGQLRQMADALRYLADKSEARGMLAGLPCGVDFPPRYHLRDLHRADQRATVRAILAGEGRDIPWTVGHDCPECDRLRLTELSCDHCGYVGAPLVFGCDCESLRTTQLADNRGYLNAMIEANSDSHRISPGVTVSRDEVERLLAELERREPGAECPAGDRGAGIRFENCMHGETLCPFCERAGVSSSDLLEDVWRLREALSSVDPLMKAAPRASDVDGDPGENGDRDDDRDDADSDDDAGDDAARAGGDVPEIISQLINDASEALASPKKNETPPVEPGGYQSPPIIFERDGERFELYRSIPRPFASNPARMDRAAVEGIGPGLADERAPIDAKAAIRFADDNIVALAAVAEIFAGRGAWCSHTWVDDDGKVRRGMWTSGDGEADTHTSLNRLHHQYLNLLFNDEIVRWPGVDGVFVEGEVPEFETPGCHAKYGNSAKHQLEIDVVLGRRTNEKTGDDMRYTSDLHVEIADDFTVQAIVLDFMKGLFDRYRANRPDAAPASADGD